MTTSRIQALKELQLPSCKHLQYLDLSHNELKMLAGSFLHDDLQVRILDLSSNHISLIEHSTLQTLEKVLRHDGFIDLSNNRLMCACHTGTLNTISSIQEQKLITVNTQDMMCLDTKANDLVFVEVVDIEKLREECFSKIPILLYVLLGFIACLLMVLIIVLLCCLWKKRFQVKSFCYKLRYEQYAPIHCEFTCYVSYARRDAPWVQDVLIPRLEERYDFKLCVPDRDFCGTDEITEILDTMTRSRSVLVVLSRNFLDDYKCRFELAQAFEQRRRHGKRVFAIKLGNIPRSVLQQDAKALELVDGDRCLEWPVTDTNPNACRYRQQLAKKKDKFWCALSQKLYKGLKPRQS